MNRRQRDPGNGLQALNLAHAPRRRSLVARCALGLALIAAASPATSAVADGGGVGPPGGGTPPPSSNPSSGSPSWTAIQKATWYGPGLWGRSTACGAVLTRGVVGVANKSLPCGTQVTLTYGDHSVVAPVIDRGPFRRGYSWDLTKRTAKMLGFLPVGAGAVTASLP